MFKRKHRTASIAVAIALAGQSAAGREEEPLLEGIHVTGMRARVSSGMHIKQDSMSIVDSIVAEDIGKLPDNNVVESLQRVAGVQVTDRGAGEVSQVLIRGLPDVSTTVNGRTMFTGTGRALALADIPSTLVSRLDVSKRRAAYHLANALAGTIDVRTFRPFDFDGSRVSLAARAVHQDRADKTDPMVSGLFSARWDTSADEFGALVNLSYAETRYRDQTTNAGAAMPFATEDPVGAFAPLEIIRSERGWMPGLDRGLPAAQGSSLAIEGVDEPYYMARDALIIKDFTVVRERIGGYVSLDRK